jgi:predicted ester cyclase
MWSAATRCMGTRLGEYMGLPPTGKSIVYNEIFICRFSGARIARHEES